MNGTVVSVRLIPGDARSRARAAALGLLLDRMLGEPPTSVHPVAAFGRLMGAIEARIYSRARPTGVLHAATGLAVGAAAGVAVRSTTVAVAGATAGRALAEAAESIGAALGRDDIDAARTLLPTLVGRDPSGLDAGEIARAVVESVAENTVDAVVAPVLWGAVAGAPGALAHRAVNTLDAMVGHRSERYEHFGWASARADDIAAWVPARVTAALVVAVRPTEARAIWRAVRDDSPAHPSPNSGVAEAAFAAALGIGLGGVSRYGDRVEERPRLGRGRPVEPADIPAAISLASDVGSALAALLLVASTVPRRSGPPQPRPRRPGLRRLPHSQSGAMR